MPGRFSHDANDFTFSGTVRLDPIYVVVPGRFSHDANEFIFSGIARLDLV